jgi:branched-chain amino acid transport system substrate-binding protein
VRVLRRSQENAIVLYGQRRIGKTSILQQLAAQLPDQGSYHPIYFDLQDKAVWPLSRVLVELARSIKFECQEDGSVKEKELPPFEEWGDNSETVFRDTWLPSVLDCLLEGASLVLLFDEFDVLADPEGGHAGTALFPYLRDLLASDPQRLQFVFVIGRKVDDLESIALSLFKGTPSKRVSLLNSVRPQNFSDKRGKYLRETLRATSYGTLYI